MRRPAGSRWQSEEGAVAVMISVIFGFLVIGLIAVSVDAGSLWASQRDLATDTDSAALAGVYLLAQMETEDCESADDKSTDEYQLVRDEVVSALAANSSGAEVEDVNVDCAAGTVEVIARTRPNTMVATVIVDDDPTVLGATTAQFRRFLDADLQPLAICTHHLDDVEEAGQGPVSVPYKWSGQAPPGCENGSNTDTGQWGWLLECEAAEAMMCWGEPGNNTIQPNNPNSWGVQIGEDFWFFIYDYSEQVTGQSPSNRQFHIIGRAQATFEGCGDTEEWPPSPNDCPGNQDWLYLDIHVIDMFEGDNPAYLPDVDYSICAMSQGNQC